MKMPFFAAACLVLLLAACRSAQERTEHEQRVLSARLKEVCALPPEKRKAALERLEQDSGLVLVCPE